MRILVINGPNLDLLGSRRPEIYGTMTLSELDEHCRAWGAALGVEVSTYQSNHEGALVDALHDARGRFDAVVLNAGALTHYSYALHDAIEAVELPTVEVHISDVKSREPWRRRSVIAPVCVRSIWGRGIDGYRWALRHLVERLARPFRTCRYGGHPDQVGDLRLPDDDGPHPVVVLLHGGFWRDPWTRDLMDAAAVDLTDRGWATWNPEYRRVGGGGGWPVTLEDAAAAVDAVGRLAADHPLDPDRVVVCGHSAGGHLALWAAARHRLPPGAPGARPRVRPVGVVALAPVADLAAAHDLRLGDDAVEAFLRRAPGHRRYDVADPVCLLPTGVPAIVVHGDADDRVPLTLSREFLAAARAHGDPVDLVELPGVDHFAVIEPRSGAWPAVVGAVGRFRRSPGPATG